MKIVILDGHAVNPGDLSWDALRDLGDLEVFDRTAEDAIVNRAREADVLLTGNSSTRRVAFLEASCPRIRFAGSIALMKAWWWRPASVGPPSAAPRPGGSEAFDAGVPFGALLQTTAAKSY